MVNADPIGKHRVSWRELSISFDSSENFTRAWQDLIKDTSLAHASTSMTILDSRTGAILFEHGKDVGLPPASSMKTITAAAALHYLGPEFTYQTLLQYSGDIDPSTGFLDGYIYVVGKRHRVTSVETTGLCLGTGDPSLGSERYDETTKAESILTKWVEAIRQAGIRKCRGVIGDPTRWGSTTSMITDGWTWNDIGSVHPGHSFDLFFLFASHWYGTGHSALNWRENEFNISIQPGCSISDSTILGNIPHPPPRWQIINEAITTANDGEASLYFALDGSTRAYLRGTVALNVDSNFYIRCSIPDSALYLSAELTRVLRENGIDVDQDASTGSSAKESLRLLATQQSPPLSKLLEPFLRISINMYGEVFVKTIADQTGLSSLVDAPLTILSTYIRSLLPNNDSSAGVALTDGSGLSRSNRLSTSALARILFTIQSQPWFESVFYSALPTINGLRMKSGTLLNTIAYAGYVPNNSLLFSFMLNNYQAESVTEMRNKVWNLLDTLK